jgi:sugar O-acyltransferase (sialic acid O-acetyltransferase NeuD family)
MKKITIYAAGGFGREILTLIKHINNIKDTYDFIGFYDDGISKGTLVNGHQVLGGLEELNKVTEPLGVVFAIGNPKSKCKVIELLNNPNLNFPILIHPNVVIGDLDFVKIGKGTIITAGCVLTTNIELGDFVILNLGCTVGHDTNIGNYSSFMPSVNISGEVMIAEKVYVGTGAKIINKLEIGSSSIIGAGAVVSKSLPSNCTAVGIPAKPIKFHEN